MTIDPMVIAFGLVNLSALAVSWGDLRRQVVEHRRETDRRHEENVASLSEIRDDVKRINGKVHEHEAILRDR